MTTNTRLTAGLALTLTGTLWTGAAFAAARISPARAEAAAVKKILGKAQSAKYEFEDGHWQYAVVVVDKAKQMYEVEVDAATGKVTDTEKTSAAEEATEEATEAAADKKAAEKKAAGK